MDSGSLVINRWGSATALVGTKLRMRKGDVLFARRNAYLRRVSIAPHDGLFSAHGMVLRARWPTVVPEFLPFFMQSDVFMERAEQISVGSISPTINWSVLREQEFSIPPIDEQRSIAEVMCAGSDLFEAARASVVAASSAVAAASKELLHHRSSDWPKVPLENIVARFIDYRGRTPAKAPAGVPLVTARNVRDGYLDFSQPEWIAPVDYESWMTRGIPEEGDVLITTEAPLGLVARAPAGRFALAQRVICLRPASGADSSFLFWSMRGIDVQRQLRQRSTGTTVNGVKQSVLRKVIVRVPSMAVQRDCARALDDLESAATSANRRLDEARQLLTKLRCTSMAGMS